jgi:hypothetical protein
MFAMPSTQPAKAYMTRAPMTPHQEGLLAADLNYLLTAYISIDGNLCVRRVHEGGQHYVTFVDSISLKDRQVLAEKMLQRWQMYYDKVIREKIARGETGRW